jgi:hypothetical protein
MGAPVIAFIEALLSINTCMRMPGMGSSAYLPDIQVFPGKKTMKDKKRWMYRALQCSYIMAGLA